MLGKLGLTGYRKLNRVYAGQPRDHRPSASGETSVPLFTPATLLLSQNNEQAFEDANEVQEQVNGVSDVVTLPALPFLDDELGVIQHETTENSYTKVEVGLEQQVRTQEQVGQGKEGHDRED